MRRVPATEGVPKSAGVDASATSRAEVDSAAGDKTDEGYAASYFFKNNSRDTVPFAIFALVEANRLVRDRSSWRSAIQLGQIMVVWMCRA